MPSESNTTSSSSTISSEELDAFPLGAEIPAFLWHCPLTHKSCLFTHFIGSSRDAFIVLVKYAWRFANCNEVIPRKFDHDNDDEFESQEETIHRHPSIHNNFPLYILQKDKSFIQCPHWIKDAAASTTSALPLSFASYTNDPSQAMYAMTFPRKKYNTVVIFCSVYSNNHLYPYTSSLHVYLLIHPRGRQIPFQISCCKCLHFVWISS